MKRALLLLVLVGCASPASYAVVPRAAAPIPNVQTARYRYVVRSVVAAFIIKHRAYRWHSNGRCPVTIVRGNVVGCKVTSPVTAYVSRGAMGLYTGRNGKGCWLGEARFYGYVYRGRVIRVKYKYTGNC